LQTASISEDSRNNRLSAGEGVIVRPDGVVIWVGKKSTLAKERLGGWLLDDSGYARQNLTWKS
jgi:hypothetical protein